VTDWKGGAPCLDLIVAGALFSITLNPIVFRTLGVAGSKAPAGGMEIPRTLK
jgi:predicted Kef-type K+ transport protein